MAVDGIEGAKPKKDKHQHIKTRETMKLDDIEGTKATIRHKGRDKSPNFDSIHYNDVTT